jgi:chloramphenicol 3-O phosphotransferase
MPPSSNSADSNEATAVVSPGRIVLLNGASSSGKSSLARVLQATLPGPFWHFSIDHLMAASVLPQQRIDSGEFRWRDLRRHFFEGFHRCIPALAQGGNNLIVEHIVETEAWMNRLLFLLADFDIYFVGVHCALPELERRATARGNGKLGEARADHAITHTFGRYDFEVDTSAELPEQIGAAVVAAWKTRQRPSAFEKMVSRKERV